jgi:hypothetical protein
MEEVESMGEGFGRGKEKKRGGESNQEKKQN